MLKMLKRKLSQLFFSLTPIIPLMIAACTIIQLSDHQVYYVVVNTSSPVLIQQAQQVIEGLSETVPPNALMVLDTVNGDQIENLYSAAATEDSFPRLLESITPRSAKDGAWIPSINRALNLNHNLKKNEILTVIIVSPGTTDRTVLNGIRARLETLKANEKITFHIVGVDPAKRIVFSGAFAPVKAVTKISSSIEEFQLHMQGE
jgi:hypothetical protein